MKTKTQKKFDSVARMRQSRDRISRETADMTVEEIVEYFGKGKMLHSRHSKKSRRTAQKLK